MIPLRGAVRDTRIFDTQLSANETYRVFYVGCHTAKAVIPSPGQTLRVTGGGQQVIDVELPCVSGARVFDITWKRQGDQTLLINCDARVRSVWPEVLSRRVVMPVRDGIVDLDHVPHGTDGGWGIIFRGALKQGNRAIYIGVERTERQAATRWNVLLRTIAVNAVSRETVHDVEATAHMLHVCNEVLRKK